jgi:spermidine/putrescine transport system ATP-binding protein
MSNKKNYLQLIGLAKAYDDGYVAVKDININIDKGEFVTLLGPSGCGKTTILKMIAGFEFPTGGQIKVDGIDIKELPVNQRPTATVFQDYALFPNMNVYQNITYGLKVMRKPLRNISSQIKNAGYKIYSNAAKKAANEIKNIQKQQAKLLREISKVESLYSAYQEVANIKNMRYAQFMMKSEYFLRKLRSILGNNATLKISLKNR